MWALTDQWCQIMRKVGAFIAIAAIAAVAFSASPAAAFGLRIGPFHIGIPFFWYGHRHLYMHANPNDLARREAEGAPGSAQGSGQGVNAALLYPNLALPTIFQSVFWPDSALWPFGYRDIFSTAFATGPTNDDQHQCQPSVDADQIVGRISEEVSPTADQMPLLQKLGGALGAASGYLAKSCPNEIPTQPIARLKLMESQLEELAMAIDVARQPLQDFEQTLSADQRSRFETATPPATAAARRFQTSIPTCGGLPTAIDWSMDQIVRSVQPTDAQSGDLTALQQSFAKAATDLETHCPTSTPPTALGRLETIQARLDATWRTVLSIQVALADFETKLSDEQKARLDNMNIAAR
jgi:hypothetical protein